MSENRRGYVMLIQGGDPEISGALAEGMLAARGNGETGDLIRPSARATFSNGRRLLEDEDPAVLEADRIAEAWVDQQRMKRTIGNLKTAEDYALMAVKARGAYGRTRQPGPVRSALLGLVALLAIAAEAPAHWLSRAETRDQGEADRRGAVSWKGEA